MLKIQGFYSRPIWLQRNSYQQTFLLAARNCLLVPEERLIAGTEQHAFTFSNNQVSDSHITHTQYWLIIIITPKKQDNTTTTNNNKEEPTSVIIDTIPTIGLESCGAILSIPSRRTSTAPVPCKDLLLSFCLCHQCLSLSLSCCFLTMKVASTLSVWTALTWTSLKSCIMNTMGEEQTLWDFGLVFPRNKHI